MNISVLYLKVVVGWVLSGIPKIKAAAAKRSPLISGAAINKPNEEAITYSNGAQ